MTVVEGKLSCRGNCQTEVARARQLFANSERAVEERSVVYGTSAKVYHQAFAFTAFFGLLFVVVGAVLLFTDAAMTGAFLIGLGVIIGIRGAGFARAGKKYKALAADKRVEGQNK